MERLFPFLYAIGARGYPTLPRAFIVVSGSSFRRNEKVVVSELSFCRNEKISRARSRVTEWTAVVVRFISFFNKL